jgi:hypothetical protein
MCKNLHGETLRIFEGLRLTVLSGTTLILGFYHQLPPKSPHPL